MGSVVALDSSVRDAEAAAVYGRVHKSSGKIRPGVARAPSRKKRPGPDSSFARDRVPKDLVRESFGWVRFNLGAHDIKRLFIYRRVVPAFSTTNAGGISRAEIPVLRGVIVIGHPVGKCLTLPSDNALSDSKFLEAGDWLNDEQHRLALTF